MKRLNLSSLFQRLFADVFIKYCLLLINFYFSYIKQLSARQWRCQLIKAHWLFCLIRLWFQTKPKTTHEWCRYALFWFVCCVFVYSCVFASVLYVFMRYCAASERCMRVYACAAISDHLKNNTRVVKICTFPPLYLHGFLCRERVFVTCVCVRVWVCVWVDFKYTPAFAIVCVIHIHVLFCMSLCLFFFDFFSY